MELAEAIEEFLTAGQQIGWSRGTLDTYKWHLERFQLWMTDHHVACVSDMDRSKVRRWGAEIRNGWAPATVKGAVAAARSCLRWLAEEGLIQTDLSNALKLPKVPETIQRTISLDEVAMLLKECETPVEHGLSDDDALATAVRNAAIVALLYDSLVRSCELVALEVKDVDPDAGRLVVRHGKGGKERMALFGPETAEALRVWLQLRRPALGVDALFVGVAGSTPGQSLTTSGLRVILRRLGERAGVDGVSPHAFRRGGAVVATLAGAPSRLVQVWGGWSNIRMVELYTRALQANPEALSVYRKFSPVSAVSNGRNGHTTGSRETEP